MRARLITLAIGADPRLRRMLHYLAATAVMYVILVVLLAGLARGGMVARPDVVDFGLYAGGGMAAFYLLVRGGRRLGLSPTALATLQGLFGISCTMWTYSITGPLHSATLMGLMLVIVFCMFALRPGQTLRLVLCGVLGLGATMWWHAAHDARHYPPNIEAATFTMMATASLAVAYLTGTMSTLRARLTAQKADLQVALERIRLLATTDELTAVANRRHMNAVLAEVERRPPSPVSGPPMCVALLDIDFFKRINDRHGHAAGDAVLRGFAQVVGACLRTGDVLARWGGEEFLVLLPDTAPDDAQALLERMRAAVAAMRPPVDVPLQVSFSGGVSARRGFERFHDTIGRADKALYRAKSAGRDRVLVDGVAD